MKKNSYRMFLTGTALGAMGVGIGMSMMNKPKTSMRRARSTAANMTSRISHDAGQIISGVGDALADRLR